MSQYLEQRRMQKITGIVPSSKKEKKPIAKMSAKKIAQEKAEKGDGEMKAWFAERRKEMKGVCQHCGGKTCKDDDNLYHFSLAHILPKAYFPSVATNKSNFIELCFWDNSCHTLMDNKILDMTDMNCWDTIVERFLEMYPVIDKDERRKIPGILMQYINIDE